MLAEVISIVNFRNVGGALSNAAGIHSRVTVGPDEIMDVKRPWNVSVARLLNKDMNSAVTFASY